ncbi:hypothetical protein L204_102782 [Cryptococcus depauperatus]
MNAMLCVQGGDGCQEVARSSKIRKKSSKRSKKERQRGKQKRKAKEKGKRDSATSRLTQLLVSDASRVDEADFSGLDIISPFPFNFETTEEL